MERTRETPWTGRELAAVFAGGMIGTLLRAGLLELWPVHAGHWPWATFAANLAGCALLGYVAASGDAFRATLIGSGLCGALTTFSTFQLELYELIDGGETPLALGYLAASIAAGFALAAMAYRISDKAEDIA